MFIFWPITDDEDVIDKDNDWICCCGIIHSFFGALLFMFADMIKIPLILSAYIGIQQYLDLQFAIDDVFFSAPIIASTIALIASPLGPIAFIRSFLCLRSSHVCSPLHNKIVVFAMFAYFIRVVLFALFSLVFTGYSLSVILHGCYWFECVKRAIHFSLWIFISLDYSIGCCLCYKALGFFRGRYRGYWDTKPSIPRKSK